MRWLWLARTVLRRVMSGSGGEIGSGIDGPQSREIVHLLGEGERVGKNRLVVVVATQEADGQPFEPKLQRRQARDRIKALASDDVRFGALERSDAAGQDGRCFRRPPGACRLGRAGCFDSCICDGHLRTSYLKHLIERVYFVKCFRKERLSRTPPK